MCRSTLRAFLWCASLLLAAASPSSSLSLSVLPAQPMEGAPFSLVIGVVADCLDLDGVVVTPGDPGLVTVTLSCIFLTPPRPIQPILLEVPIGPLPEGRWILRVVSPGGQENLQVDVAPLPFALELDPPHPPAGSPFTVRLGSDTLFSELD